MRDAKERKHFGAYINKLRLQRGFQLEQTGDGLCTEQMLSYLENGKRTVPKLLQDALLERLGVGAEDYEHYLDYREYAHWEARQRILYYIMSEEPEQAADLLEQYRMTYIKSSRRNVSDRLEWQFYLSMQAQIRLCKGAERRELLPILEEAAHMTMPRLKEKKLEKCVLSIKELNLILETEHSREGGGCQEHYLAVLDYIDTIGLDGVGRAKIYPKAVYFLGNCLLGKTVDEHCTKENSAVMQGQDTTGNQSTVADQQLLRYCNLAVECLRDHSRMYYLWELLDMREQLLGRMAEDFIQRGEYAKAETLKPILRENAEWKDALESVYEEFGVRKETFSYCYLYVEKGVVCINDIVRIRRRMLGIDRQTLCEGFCDVKTLERLENKKTVPQNAIVEGLFDRLGLPRERWRTELVTEKPEARELMTELRKCINDRRMEEAERLYKKMKELVPLEIRCNQQTLLHGEILLQEELDAQACYKAFRIAVELTLPYKVFLKEGEKYLTYEEQSCIKNMMPGMDKNSEEFMLCIKRFEEIYRTFEKNALIGTVNNMYEFIMGYVGSERGNLGDFDRSDRYIENIIDESLRFRRLSPLPSALYGRWWNDAERKQKGFRSEYPFDRHKELTRCIVLCRLSKRKYYAAFYQKKLDEEQLGKEQITPLQTVAEDHHDGEQYPVHFPEDYLLQDSQW